MSSERTRVRDRGVEVGIITVAHVLRNRRLRWLGLYPKYAKQLVRSVTFPCDRSKGINM